MAKLRIAGNKNPRPAQALKAAQDMDDAAEDIANHGKLSRKNVTAEKKKDAAFNEAWDKAAAQAAVQDAAYAQELPEITEAEIAIFENPVLAEMQGKVKLLIAKEHHISADKSADIYVDLDVPRFQPSAYNKADQMQAEGYVLINTKSRNNDTGAVYDTLGRIARRHQRDSVIAGKVDVVEQGQNLELIAVSVPLTGRDIAELARNGALSFNADMSPVNVSVRLNESDKERYLGRREAELRAAREQVIDATSGAPEPKQPSRSPSI